MASLRDALVGLTLKAEQRQQGATARRFFLGLGALLRGPATVAQEAVTSIADLMHWADTTADGWTQAGNLDAGGDVDACDLRVWLDLAERAGVPYVPARTILTLHEDELGALAGSVQAPGFVGRALARGAARVFGQMDTDPNNAPEHTPVPDRTALTERLFAAMDDVPDGWMVRSHICGPSTLKTLAGAGVIADANDTVASSPEFAVGPGWIRHGNRRRVDAANGRYVELFPQGHGTTIAYLARPWVAAGRRAEGPDPHRHGTPFAGKGSWPCEWRVFVENGTVVGVAAYYAWIGAATPKNARMALEAGALAQRIVDAGVALAVRPVVMDLLIAERQRGEGADLPPILTEALARFGTGFSCTLDFIESEDGLMLLEGGPAHMPIGGGHPCAFAGVGRSAPGSACRTVGVALGLMDHVVLADPRTWIDGDHTGKILSWDEARALAQQD